MIPCEVNFFCPRSFTRCACCSLILFSGHLLFRFQSRNVTLCFHFVTLVFFVGSNDMAFASRRRFPRSSTRCAWCSRGRPSAAKRQSCSCSLLYTRQVSNNPLILSGHKRGRKRGRE